MGADSQILSLLVKLVADASQMISEIKKGETAFVGSTDKMTDAQRRLLAEHIQASNLESKFDAERQREAQQRTQLVLLSNEQAAAEKSAADATALAAEAREVERVKTEYINDLLREQSLRLKELKADQATHVEYTELEQAATERMAVAQEKATLATEEFSVRGLLPVLVNLRTLARVATGIFAIGFIVSEWQTFVQWIRNAADEMGGFDASLKEVQADAIKASNDALTDVNRIKEQWHNYIMGAKDAKELRARQTDAEIYAIDVAQKGAERQQSDARTRLALIDEYEKSLKAKDESQYERRQKIVQQLRMEGYEIGSGNEMQASRVKLTKELLDVQTTLDKLASEKNREAERQLSEKLTAEAAKGKATAREQKQLFHDNFEDFMKAQQLLQKLETEQSEFFVREGNRLARQHEKELTHSEAMGKKLGVQLEQAAAAKIKLQDFYIDLNNAAGHFEDEAQKETDKAREYTLNSQEKYLRHQIELHGKTAIFYHAEAAQLLKLEQDKLKIRRDMEAQRIDDELAAAEKEIRVKLEAERRVKGADPNDIHNAELEAEAAVLQTQTLATQKKLELNAEEATAEKNLAETYRQAAIMKTEADAQSVASGAARLLGVLGHKKAEAYVEMVMHTASGIGDLAVGDFVGAALEFMSASEYGIIAGRSGGKHGGGAGGSTGSTRESAARNSGGGSRGNGPGVVMGESGSNRGGSGGHTSITNINVTGGMISADTMQQFQTQAGVGQNAGLFRVNANTTSGIPAPRA